MRIKLHEAIKAYQDRTGVRLTQNDIAREVYPESSHQSAAIGISKIATGKAKMIAPETILTICWMTGVDANFLYGL